MLCSWDQAPGALPNKQLANQKEKGYSDQTNSRDDKFILLCVCEHPDDENNRDDWNHSLTAKFKGCAVAANIASIQFERGEATQNVKQQHHHVRKHGEFLKG